MLEKMPGVDAKKKKLCGQIEKLAERPMARQQVMTISGDIGTPILSEKRFFDGIPGLGILLISGVEDIMLYDEDDIE